MSGTTIGDVIFDQTYQIGVNANTNTSEIGGADDQGLGLESGVNRLTALQKPMQTCEALVPGLMTLADGHRVPTNVSGYGANTRRTGADLGNSVKHRNCTNRQHSRRRIGYLRAEAVPGVVNMIPRKLRRVYGQLRNAASAGERCAISQTRLLAGAQGERTSLIFAVEISDADSMAQTDRPDYVVNSAGWTGQNLPTYGERGNGLPGDWRVPLRNATGALADAANDDPALAGTNPFWFSANAQHSTALGRDIHEVYNNINLNNAAGHRVVWTRPVLILVVLMHYLKLGFSTVSPRFRRQHQYVSHLHLEDPGCNNDFGAGHNSLGTAPNLNT